MVRAKPAKAGLVEGKGKLAKAAGKRVKAEKRAGPQKKGVSKKGAVGRIKKARFWAVKVGRCPGVYTDKERFQQQVEAFSGSVSRRFNTREEAELFLQDGADAKAAHANKILTSFAQTNNGGVKFDRSAFGRGFALGVPRFQRGPAARTAVQPVFGLVPSHPTDSELPHHKELRLSLGAAAAAAAPAPAGGSPAVPSASSPRGSPAAAAEAQRTFGASPAAAAETASAAAEAAGQAGKDDDASSSDGGTTGGDSAGSGEDSDGDAASDGAMRDLDEDFILMPVGPSAHADAERLASEAASAAEDAAKDTTGLGYTPAKPAAELRRTWETWEHPWYDANQHIRSQSLRLHNEIVELTTLLRSTGEEDKQRRDAVDSVEAVVQSVFPGAQLKVFGSFSTGLHLPTSDVDCVILEAQVASVPMALQGLGKALQRMEWSSELEVITKARVPLVKLRVMPQGLKFDISMGMDNGTKAVELVKTYLTSWPAMRPLVTILKLFLLQRNLNEVYSGGLGSFALLVSVVSFLQLHHSRTLPMYHDRQMGKLDCNLGVLLIDYFRFYGRSLNYYDVGVTCAKGGYCYNKRATVRQDPRDKGDRLSLLDPLDDTNDVSRGTFNMRAIRSAFDHAYGTLTIPANRSDALLARILRLDEVLSIRPPPAKERPASRAPKQKHGKRAAKASREAPRHEFSGGQAKRSRH